MAKAPNHQKLIIPGKNSHGAHAGYSEDSRAIEMWANEGIVRKLIAGSNITLTPPDGIDQGQGIEIAASGGGGGGANFGFFTMLVGSEDYGFEPNAGSMYLSPNDSDGTGTSRFLLMSRNAPATPPDFIIKDIGTGWQGYVGPGESALQWPKLIAPTFTGATFITVALVISAFSVTSTTDLLGGSLQAQQMQTQSPDIQLTSGQTYQTTAADFPDVVQSYGGDLSLVAGTGPGTGFVSASGDFMYFGSVTGQVTFNGATFT